MRDQTAEERADDRGKSPHGSERAEFDTRAVRGQINSPDVELGASRAGRNTGCSLRTEPSPRKEPDR